MPTMNLGVMEYRIKREERKMARYELKKARIDLEKLWVTSNRTEAFIGRVGIRATMWVLVVMFVVLGITLPIDGVVKNYYDDKTIAKCEQMVAQQHLVANCDSGIIGKTTPNGK